MAERPWEFESPLSHRRDQRKCGERLSAGRRQQPSCSLSAHAKAAPDTLSESRCEVCFTLGGPVVGPPFRIRLELHRADVAESDPVLLVEVRIAALTPPVYLKL